MTLFALNIFLGLIWAAVTGTFSVGGIVLGFILGYGVLWIARPLYPHTEYFRRAPKVIGFFFYFLWELFYSSLRVAHDVLTPTAYARPGVIALPLGAETDLEITLLACLITLTPGTLSLDVSKDRKVLYVHGMFIDDPDALREELKNGMERRLLEVLR